MWTKVKKHKSAKREKRVVPAVSRIRSGNRQASLILPQGMATAAAADIYSDGNGKLAFAFSDKGAYKVFRRNRTSVSDAICIPLQFADLFPFGTNDAALTPDGDMLVLDSAQFKTA